MRKIDALLRYNFKVDTDKLDDDEWAMLWNDLLWIREQEKKALNRR